MSWYDTLDLGSIRPISKNINNLERIKTYFDEVCTLQILPIVGAEIYQQIENGTITATDELLIGCYYTVQCGSNTVTKYQNGINKALLYLVYSRLIMNNQITTTAFGVVNKTNRDVSEPIDEKNLIRQANEAEMIGKEYLRQVEEYIHEILTPNDCCKRKKVHSTRLRKVGVDVMHPIYGNSDIPFVHRNILY